MLSETIFIRNDLLKLLYSGMLLRFPPDQVRLFWQRNTVPGFNREGGESEMYRFLWNEKNKTPFQYVFDTMNALQGFLLQSGISPYDFIEDSLCEVNQGAFISAKTLLWWVQPSLEKFFAEKDLHALMLHQAPIITQNMCSALIHEMVSFTTGDVYNTACMMIMLATPPRSFQLFAKTFGVRLPPYDVELWTGAMTKSAPTVLNLPAFESLGAVCDTRSVEDVLSLAKSHCPDLRNCSLKVETISFYEFYDRSGLDLSKYKIPDVKVQTVDADIYCSSLKRNVLYKECAYDAPVGVYKLRYTKSVEKPKKFLSRIFDEALGENSRSIALLTHHHDRLLEDSVFKAVFVYNAEHETLSVNGKLLVRFVPAKMLRKILKSYTQSGQEEFAYRDFSYDTEVVEHNKTSNIHVRFGRLFSVLKEDFPHLILTKSGKGKFVLKTSCKIDFREE